MGYTPEGDECAVLTGKPVEPLLGNTVWIVMGHGTPRTFALESVFRVSEVGDSTEAEFKNQASGTGHRFRPPIPLNDLEWFPEFKAAVGRFQFGVQPLNDETHVKRLRSLAQESGVELP